MNKNQSIFTYLVQAFEAQHSNFSKMMFVQKDTVFDAKDSGTVQVAKAMKRLDSLQQIKEMTEHKGWLILEELLLDRVRGLDNEWAQLILDGDEKQLKAIAVTRTGIGELITIIDGVALGIDEELANIKKANILIKNEENEKEQTDSASNAGETDSAPIDEELE